MLKRFLPITSFRIWGKSMEPTYVEGGRIFVDKTAFKFSFPRVGSAVVVRHPYTRTLMVKRVIARPRSRVHTQWGRLFVDGTRYEHLHTPGGFIGAADVRDEWLVPKESYFVVGDNPAMSTDSRHFGCVHRRAIIGQVLGQV
jgi:signal peptidase I